jgi:hypothetical protein
MAGLPAAKPVDPLPAQLAERQVSMIDDIDHAVAAELNYMVDNIVGAGVAGDWRVTSQQGSDASRGAWDGRRRHAA